MNEKAMESGRPVVWLVECGNYSDYHVVGVFSASSNADLIASEINKSEDVYYRATVRSVILDPAVKELREGMKLYEVDMLKDGVVAQCEETADIPTYWISGESKVLIFGRADRDCIRATVWARDQEHAIKIVNEYRTQAIATGEWK